MFEFLSYALKKGISLMRQKEYAEAEVYFEGLVKKGIHTADSYFNLGKCNFKLGRLDLCRENFHKALNIKPSSYIKSGIIEVTNWEMLSSNKYFNSWPNFSTDGNFLTYTSARKDSNNDGRIDASDTCGIYVMDISTRKERAVVPDKFYNQQPVFSPDGFKLVFLSGRNQVGDAVIAGSQVNKKLYLLDLITGEETILLGENSLVKHYFFTSEGSKIIFSGWYAGNSKSGIYSIELKNGDVEALVSDSYENTSSCLSRLSDKIVYSSWRKDTNNDGVIDFHDNSGIFLKYFFDGSEIVIAGDEFNNTFPVFSLDSSKVLYLSVRRDTNGDGRINSLDNSGIYIMDLNSKREYCVISDEFYNKFPSFTPEGKNIVFVSNWHRPRNKKDEAKDLFENKGIYMSDIYGRKINQIFSDKYYSSRSPVVSPKGGTIAYVSWRRNTNRGLYLANMNYFPMPEALHKWIDINI